VAKLLEKSGQLWTQLLEDGSLQELQGKEDKLHATMADVKQRQRTMSLPKKIKTAAEMKNLQARRKSSAGTKDHTIGSVGASTRKGRTVGHGNRHNKSTPRTDRLRRG
jgi:hypothetical protein